MVTRAALSATFVLCGLAVSQVRAAPPAFEPFQSLPIGYMVKDGKGVIWGATSVPNLPIYRLTATGWTAVRSSGDFNRYASLTLSSDGTLYGLLINDGTRTGAIVHYTTAGAQTLGTFPWTHPVTELLIARDGTAWVTGSGREIRHVFGSGKPDATYDLPTNVYNQNVFLYNPQSDTAPVGAATDGTGRIWFYSKPNGQGGLPYIHGIIVFNGETYTQIPSLFDAPDEPIAALIPKDKDHFWALYPDTGLMSIDTTAYAAERVTEPSPGAFHHPRKLIKDGPDWLLMTRPVRPPQELQGTLWRFHSSQSKDDKPGWTKLAEGFETSASWPETPPPVAVTASGTWIGDSARGIWWFDRQTGKRQLIDWHQGFPLYGVSSLVKTADGQTVAAQFGSRPVVLPAAPPPPAPMSGIREHITAYISSGLQADQAGHLWGKLQNGRGTLDEWDGSRWISYPLPPKIDPRLLSAIVPDTLGRIWCIQPQKFGVALYDAKARTWTTFDDLQSALAGSITLPGFGFHTDWSNAPVIRNGRIAAYDDKPMYYDGKSWKTWESQTITNSEYVNAMPYFNSKDRLTVRGSSHDWTWDGNVWNRGAEVDYRKPSPQDALRNRVISILRSLGWPSSSTNRVVSPVEEQGVIWFFIDRTLYVLRSGMVRPQFDDHMSNPFLQLPLLREVRIDALSHVWLGSLGDNSLRYLELTTPSHKPFALSLATKSEDSVAADVTGDRAALYEWRIDGEPGTATADPTRTFTNVPPGDHIVWTQPLTDHLLPIGPPITKSWRSAVTAEVQLPRLIASLTMGTDADRTEAVNALARYGNRAFEKLTAARAGATASGKWWIDAALQEITNRTTNSKPEETHE